MQSADDVESAGEGDHGSIRVVDNHAGCAGDGEGGGFVGGENGGQAYSGERDTVVGMYGCVDVTL